MLLNAAEVLYEYCKEQKQDQVQEPKEAPKVNLDLLKNNLKVGPLLNHSLRVMKTLRPNKKVKVRVMTLRRMKSLVMMMK